MQILLHAKTIPRNQVYDVVYSTRSQNSEQKHRPSSEDWSHSFRRFCNRKRIFALRDSNGTPRAQRLEFRDTYGDQAC